MITVDLFLVDLSCLLRTAYLFLAIFNFFKTLIFQDNRFQYHYLSNINIINKSRMDFSLFQDCFIDKGNQCFQPKTTNEVGEQLIIPNFNACPQYDIYSQLIDIDIQSRIRPHSEAQDMDNFVDRLNSTTKLQNSKFQNSSHIKKKKKNSNVIKKIGRIIYNKRQIFETDGQFNEGFQNMIQLLSKKSNNRNVKDMIDGFNFQHLKILFTSCNLSTTSRNLKITQNLLNRYLRKEVLSSRQIKDQENQLLYLNTLKCSSIRCMNKDLALRLQCSEQE